MLLDSHNNVESCTGVQRVKHIYKYVHKGHDRCVATVPVCSVQQQDEYLESLGCRRAFTALHVFLHKFSPSACPPLTEFVFAASFRLVRPLGGCCLFPLHNHRPAVERLAVRLEGEQGVTFRAMPGEKLQTLLERAETQRFTVTAWLQLDNENWQPGPHRQYLYKEPRKLRLAWQAYGLEAQLEAGRASSANSRRTGGCLCRPCAVLRSR